LGARARRRMAARLLNGECGLIFFTDDDSERWEPEFASGDLENLHWFIDELPFDDHGRFSRKAQASLFAMNLFHAFFPPWRRTRLISASLGGQGAGKSTGQRLTGRLLVGPPFEASDVRADREDAFFAAITNKVVYAIDNADSRISWLPDALARYATGNGYRMRRQRSTNEIASYEPRAMLMISSRDPHFTRGDVAERLLPMHCRRPDEFIPEHILFGSTRPTSRRNCGGSAANARADCGPHRPSQPNAVNFRMADFGSFVLRSVDEGSAETGDGGWKTSSLPKRASPLTEMESSRRCVSCRTAKRLLRRSTSGSFSRPAEQSRKMNISSSRQQCKDLGSAFRT
jgi:hypothetical protein